MSHIVLRHHPILHAEMSSIRDNDITITSSQLPPANGGDGPSGSGPATVIGAVVAVVIVLVVGSVIVAALLIAWRLRSSKKRRDSQVSTVIELFAVGFLWYTCAPCHYWICIAQDILKLFCYIVVYDPEKQSYFTIQTVVYLLTVPVTRIHLMIVTSSTII